MGVSYGRPTWTTIGGDPEVPIFGMDGKLVTPKKELGKNTFNRAVEIDGFMAELHPSPTRCRETLISRYGTCLSHLLQHMAKTTGNTVDVKSIIDIPAEVLRDASDEEVALGCEPDIDAYSGNVNVAKVDGRKILFRSGGGHMHFGYNQPDWNRVMYLHNDKWCIDQDYKNIAPKIIQMMDYLVGVPSVLLDTGPEPAKRRELYGKAGSFRIQPHGIEYRVLSNFWMQHPALVSIVYLLGRVSLIIATEYPNMAKEIFATAKPNDVRYIINENDEEEAYNLTMKLTPYIQKVTDFKVMPLIFYIHEVGKNKLFKPHICDNWGIRLLDRNNHTIRDTKNWWGMQRSGLHTFLQNMPYERARAVNDWATKLS